MVASSTVPPPAPPLLSVRNLSVRFRSLRGEARVVDDVSFDVPERTTVALVGESGSGKTVTSQAILRLVPPTGEIVQGEVLFEGKNLLAVPEKELLSVRGRRISMVFQEPMTSLNPVYRVGAQIGEVIRLHDRENRGHARERARELLRLVGIPAPEVRLDAYPHELSGGMRQRVMIAMALAGKPSLLIADEPTTALDVSVQAQILELFRTLQAELSMSILFITHDLGIVAQFASAAVVMYAGRVVETGPVAALFRAPAHPYTKALLASSPPEDGSRPRRLGAIPGIVPDPFALPVGCRFAPRCPLRAEKPPGFERCTQVEPELQVRPDGRASRCHFGDTAS